jgi:magnesium chelatase family protein
VEGKECRCSGANIARYERKLSGPIVDRIDLWAEVSKVDYDKLDIGMRMSESEDGTS